jgi:hypothetical protein
MKFGMGVIHFEVTPNQSFKLSTWPLLKSRGDRSILRHRPCYLSLIVRTLDAAVLVTYVPFSIILPFIFLKEVNYRALEMITCCILMGDSVVVCM